MIEVNSRYYDPDDPKKELRSATNAGIAANTLPDSESGLTDRKITPGGGIQPEGFGLKTAGDAAGVGLFLKNVETGQATQIPKISIKQTSIKHSKLRIKNCLTDGVSQIPYRYKNILLPV
ncbi:MAG: DUF4469 domain-containing protein [Prevotellaceae bacterium]|jgi:hypothetical protein|nr:DUF4469 domain-containing protein [Prevotellaceae bacterium]